MATQYNGMGYEDTLICDVYCLGTGGESVTVNDEWGEYEECQWSNINSTELWPNDVCGDYVY
jgi:hypothetical protein